MNSIVQHLRSGPHIFQFRQYEPEMAELCRERNRHTLFNLTGEREPLLNSGPYTGFLKGGSSKIILPVHACTDYLRRDTPSLHKCMVIVYFESAIYCVHWF